MMPRPRAEGIALQLLRRAGTEIPANR
jgi:hypothetical protein